MQVIIYCIPNPWPTALLVLAPILSPVAIIMSQGSSSSEEEDVSPLTYARLNGLYRDYLSENLGFAEVKGLQWRVDGVLFDDAHLPQFSLGTGFKVEERIALPKDAAPLLAWVTREETKDEIDSLAAPILDGHLHSKKRRLELPLLRSDHEMDCRQFARREGFDVRLEDVKLPLEVVNDYNNEGLNWSADFCNLGSGLLEELKLEKIQVTKDAIIYLQESLNVIWTEDDDLNLWAGELPYQRVSTSRTKSYLRIATYNQL